MKELKSAESKEKTDLLWKKIKKMNMKIKISGPRRKLELSEEYWPPIPIINPGTSKIEQLILKKSLLQKELEKVNKAIQSLKRKK